jgi:subtilisin family serine protease
LSTRTANGLGRQSGHQRRWAAVAVSLWVLAFGMLVSPPAALSQPIEGTRPEWVRIPDLDHVPGRVLVEFKPGVGADRRTEALSAAGVAATVARIGPRGAKNVELVRVKPGVSVEVALRRLRNHPAVVAAEPDLLLHPSAAIPNDPFFGDQWGLRNTGQTIKSVAGVVNADIDAELGWAASEGHASDPVNVAVIDTGIDAGHPDLSASLWRNPGEIAGNGVDDDGNGFVDDITGYNMVGLSHTATNVGLSLGRDDTFWQAQSIKGTGQGLSQVGILVRRVGEPTANIQIAVRDALNGADLATATIPAADIGDAWAVIERNLSPSLSLVSGKTYFLLFRATASSANNHYWLASNSSAYADYRGDLYRDGMQHWWNGTSWQDRANDDWYFLTNPNANPRDDNGHGTHVAGIIGAGIDNGVGIAGVSYGARIMVLKAGAPYFPLSAIVQALSYATDNRARVINMSLGSSSYSSILRNATDRAQHEGAALFAAAGNDGDATFNFPAANPNVVGVGATNNKDAKAGFSNANASVDISAPGEHIYSTMPTYPVGMNSLGYAQDYDFVSGTSMATPMAAGLAGLVLSRNPDLTNSQVVQLIENSLRDDKGPAGWDSSFGTGRITARNMANEVLVGNNRIDGGVWLPSPAYGETLDSTGDHSDIFAVHVPAGHRIKVTLELQAWSPGSDIDLYLYPPGTTDAHLTPFVPNPAVASSTGSGHPKSLSYVAPAGSGGTYYLHVKAAAGRATYLVTHSVKGADDEIPGVPLPPSPVNGGLQFLFDEDDVFAVGLSEGEQIMTTLSGAVATDFELLLYPPGSGDFSATAVAVSSGPGYPQKLKHVVQAGAGGTYYLRVAQIPGSFDGAYTLSYSIGPADLTPPTTSLTTDPAMPNGDNDWFLSAPRITLSANEPAVVYHQWNTTWSGWWSEYAGPFFAYEGNNQLHFYAVDVSGNVESVKTRPVRLDMTLPINPALHSSSHTLGQLSGNEFVDVGLSGASDWPSGVDGYSVAWNEKAVDLPDTTKEFEGSPAAIRSPALSDGDWYLHLRTRDKAGNWSGAVHLGPFSIDVTPPVTVVTLSPAGPDGDNGWYATRPTLTLSHVGETAAAYFHWQASGVWEPYSQPLTAPEGADSFSYYSVDAVGNVERPVKELTVKSDTVAPSTPSLSVTEDATGVLLSWSAAADETSGVDRYEVRDADSGQPVATTTALSHRPAGLLPGVAYRFQVRAVDVAGNISADSNVVSVAPVGSGQNVPVSVGGVGVTFSSLDSPGIVVVESSSEPLSGQTGFQLNGVYYDIRTTAQYSGPVTVTLTYDPASVADPQSLRLYHHDAGLGSWVDITTGVDTVNHTVSGSTTSFSWFAAGRPGQVFRGFGAPLIKGEVIPYTFGQTIPVKFRLTDQAGNYVTKASARIFVAKVTGGVAGPEKPGTSSLKKADNAFRYAKSEDQYVYNLQTQSLEPGLWRLRVVVDDGLSYLALVLLTSAGG